MKENNQQIRSGQPYLYRSKGFPSEVYQVRFRENIDNAHLNEALQQAIVRYPYFKIKLYECEGDFFCQENPLPLIACETEELPILGSLENNEYLIGITHHGVNMNISFHHALTDGRGIKNFLETLIYYYCRIHYGNTDLIPGIHTAEEEVSQEEYAEPCAGKFSYNKENAGKVEGITRKAFILPETKLPPVSHRRYEMRFPQQEFMALCKQYGASPIILLSVMMSRAIQKLYPDNTRTINSNFPVDIRQALGMEETFKNCVKSISLPYGTSQQSMSTAELCQHYKSLMQQQRRPDYCRKEQNMIVTLLNAVSLFHSYEKKQKLLSFLEKLKLDTYLISYIGQFNLGSNEKYVDSVHLFSNGSDGLVLNMTCSGGYFTIDFVQDFESECYINALAEEMGEMGICAEVSGRIEFTTPCDRLMQDMEHIIIDRPNIWEKTVSANVNAYQTVEDAFVNTFTGISDRIECLFNHRDRI